MDNVESISRIIDAAKTDIFEADQIVMFAILALTEFNGIPKFTFYTFADDISDFEDMIVEVVMLYVEASVELIEQGKMISIFELPTISDLFGTKQGSALNDLYNKIKKFKST